MTPWDEAWEHLRFVYEHTDREYTLEAAKWEEQNQPWYLAGLRLKMEQAIQKKEGR